VPALQSLIGSRHRVVAVYTQPDRPAGRGRQLAMSAVKQCALAHQLPVEQVATLRDPQAVERLASYRPDVMVVVAYGLLLPEPVLTTPRLGCINIHASLLPRWRGAAPIQRALLAGDRVTGVTIMQMDTGLDTGPMLIVRPVDIAPDETAASLHDRLAALGGEALLEALDAIATGTARPQAQPTEGVTYAHKLRKEEAMIDWQQPAVQIDRQVRAFNPWPIAQTLFDGRQLRIWQSAVLEGGAGQAPGTVIGVAGSGMDVATSEGILRVQRLQLAGRNVVTAAEFANAHRVLGARLGAV
jgi:methionyl-tRNA formyltransferase